MAYLPEELAKDLKQAHGEHLVAVILYGSAASGERHARYSDYNVLVVLDAMDAVAVGRAAGAVRRWTRAGNHPPVTMTAAFLRASADAFPLEWLDMKDAREVLIGEDLLKDLHVPPAALRLELERELRSALLRLLRDLQTVGWFRKSAALRALLVRHASTFQVLFRGLLRLTSVGPLPPKREAAAALAKALAFDAEPFLWADRLKHGDGSARREAPGPWADRYVKAVEALIERVDSLKR